MRLRLRMPDRRGLADPMIRGDASLERENIRMAMLHRTDRRLQENSSRRVLSGAVRDNQAYNEAMLRTRIVLAATAAVVTLLGLCFFAVRSTHAQSTRVFELRTYTCNEGKLPDLEKRFRDHTIEIFNRHHITSIGYWIPQDPPRSENVLIYIVSHPSREAAKENWAAFGNDPAWKKVAADSEANGKIVNHVDSVFLNPTDFSPIK